MYSLGDAQANDRIANRSVSQITLLCAHQCHNGDYPSYVVFQFRLVFESYSLGRVRHSLDRRKRSGAGTLQSAGEMYDEPLLSQSITNFASSYKSTPVLAASLTALYHRNFTHRHLFRSLRAVHGDGAPQPGLKPSVRIRISSCRAFMIRSMLVPLWLRRVNCGFALLAHRLMYAPLSRVLFSLLLPGLYTRPQDVSASAIYWEVPSSKSARSVLVAVFVISASSGAALYVMV